jgi:hypothetical protein
MDLSRYVAPGECGLEEVARDDVAPVETSRAQAFARAIDRVRAIEQNAGGADARGPPR